MQFELLSESLGYHFNNLNLLEHALRHRSMGKPSNERLEFLGDAVLNYVITAKLFNLYPNVEEGDLSRWRANLVKGEVLAELAQDLKLGKYMRFGSGELRSGGPQRKSILADAMEAVIGAIYLDSNIEVCQSRILFWYEKRLQQIAIISQKDPKTRLQELLQVRKLSLPDYKVVSIKGAAHEQIFSIECRVNGLELVTTGVGSNKRSAEQEAAEKFLAKIEI